MSAPGANIWSSSAIQLAARPAHMIGVEPMNRRSPVNDPTVRVVHGDIPVGMRRPGSEQSDRAVTDPQLDVRRDGVVGQPRVDPGKSNLPNDRWR